MSKVLDSSFIFSDIEKRVSTFFFGDSKLSKASDDTWSVVVHGKISEAYRVKKNGSCYKFERIP